MILDLAWWMNCSTGTNSSDSSPIEEAATDITWVLAQLSLALNVASGDKGKKRDLETGDSDDLPSAKRYLIFSQYLIKGD